MDERKPVGEVRRAVLKRLVTPHMDTRFHHAYLVRSVSGELGCRALEVWEALWGLVGDGLAYLDPDGQAPDNWRWRASAEGIRVASGGPWEPRDPLGYVARLRERAPGIEDAAIRYVEEALRSYTARCYLASSVMLGVAAEQVFGRAAAAMVAAPGVNSGKLEGMISNPRSSYHQQFEEFTKRLDPLRDALPANVVDRLTLDSVVDLLRVARNAAGHPTGQDVDEETARAHLQVGAGLLAKLTELARHLESMRADGALSEANRTSPQVTGP